MPDGTLVPDGTNLILIKETLNALEHLGDDSLARNADLSEFDNVNSTWMGNYIQNRTDLTGSSVFLDPSWPPTGSAEAQHTFADEKLTDVPMEDSDAEIDTEIRTIAAKVAIADENSMTNYDANEDSRSTMPSPYRMPSPDGSRRNIIESITLAHPFGSDCLSSDMIRDALSSSSKFASSCSLLMPTWNQSNLFPSSFDVLRSENPASSSSQLNTTSSADTSAESQLSTASSQSKYDAHSTTKAAISEGSIVSIPVYENSTTKTVSATNVCVSSGFLCESKTANNSFMKGSNLAGDSNAEKSNLVNDSLGQVYDIFVITSKPSDGSSIVLSESTSKDARNDEATAEELDKTKDDHATKPSVSTNSPVKEINNCANQILCKTDNNLYDTGISCSSTSVQTGVDSLVDANIKEVEINKSVACHREQGKSLKESDKTVRDRVNNSSSTLSPTKLKDNKSPTCRLSPKNCSTNVDMKSTEKEESTSALTTESGVAASKQCLANSKQDPIKPVQMVSALMETSVVSAAGRISSRISVGTQTNADLLGRYFKRRVNPITSFITAKSSKSSNKEKVIKPSKPSLSAVLSKSVQSCPPSTVTPVGAGGQMTSPTAILLSGPVGGPLLVPTVSPITINGKTTFLLTIPANLALQNANNCIRPNFANIPLHLQNHPNPQTLGPSSLAPLLLHPGSSTSQSKIIGRAVGAPFQLFVSPNPSMMSLINAASQSRTTSVGSSILMMNPSSAVPIVSSSAIPCLSSMLSAGNQSFIFPSASSATSTFANSTLATPKLATSTLAAPTLATLAHPHWPHPHWPHPHWPHPHWPRPRWPRPLWPRPHWPHPHWSFPHLPHPD